jgi:hypothetical protein
MDLPKSLLSGVAVAGAHVAVTRTSSATMATTGATFDVATTNTTPAGIASRRRGRRSGRAAVTVLCEDQAAETQDEDQRQDYPKFIFHFPPASAYSLDLVSDFLVPGVNSNKSTSVSCSLAPASPVLFQT